VGWTWALVLTIDYLLRTWTVRRRATGSVLVLDRALPDAMVELGDDYGVVLRLGLQRRLLERFTPAPDITFHIRLPGAVAKARKDDVFTVAELEAQARRYEELLADMPGVVVLDGRKPPDELALEALRAVASPPGAAQGRPWQAPEPLSENAPGPPAIGRNCHE
jgi:thymidylate kinase